MTRIVIAAMLVLLTAGSAVAQSQQPAAPSPPGDAAAGRRAFVEYACFYCHGTAAQGGLAAVGPRIARVARSVESFRAYVRQPSGRMSSYSERVIPDQALADIYAYLRSLPEPAPTLPQALQQLLRRP